MTSNSQRELFITADDRTGSLEIGGLIATQTTSVPVGPLADSTRCCVVDLASRHVSPEEAIRRTLDAHQRVARHRCHKMDAGLRGNWPHEIRALIELGFQIAVVPSFPDAGRICKDGVVYIQGLAVLDSPFGADPLTAPCSSKPIEVLEEADCVFDAIEVWDASDNDELREAVRRCQDEGRVLVGPSGAVSAYAERVIEPGERRRFDFQRPLLIGCGSLNATSRNQLDQLDIEQHILGSSLPDLDDVLLLVTPYVEGAVATQRAVAVADQMAETIKSLASKANTLLIIGGDTLAAVVGDQTVDALGTVEAGIPVSEFDGHLLISKGGGIGTEQSVRLILDAVS